MTKGESKIARKYLISGRVQGVGYRFFVEEWANRVGIRGYVRNRWDGNVEVYAIGDRVQLEEFKRHLADGPRSARVINIQEFTEAVNNRYHQFVIEG